MKTRLENKLNKTDNCWNWTGRLDRDGYGMVDGVLRKNYGQRAHRVSYQIYKGDIPNGLVVLHSCDNPSCCNPDHLSVGTQADNVKDAQMKGRLKGNPRGLHVGCNHRRGICLIRQN